MRDPEPGGHEEPKQLSRPTVNDVARTAGVSLATVDRVLNGRPGVREVTVRRVNEAIGALGYVRDVSAANLARQRHYGLVLFLPEGDGEFVRALVRAAEAAAPVARVERTGVEVRRHRAHDPHALARDLDALDGATTDGVAIMAPETPHVRDAVTRLKARGIAVVALVSDLPSTARDRFVGIDNVAAGRTAGALLGRFVARARGPASASAPDSPREPARVLVLAGSTRARDGVERRLGLDAVLAERFAGIEALPSLEGHEDPATIRRAVGNALDAHPGVAGVYSLGTEHGALIEALVERELAGRVPVLVHELTAHARAALLAGTVDAVITQDAGHVVRSALRVLRATSDALDVDAAQETVRIEIVLRENLPSEAFDTEALQDGGKWG